MGLDTVFWMGSCTKLLTSISVLQCVEKGYFTLDEDVTRLLPELKDIEVQIPAKVEDGVETAPTRVKAKNVITLRCVHNQSYLARTVSLLGLWKDMMARGRARLRTAIGIFSFTPPV